MKLLQHIPAWLKNKYLLTSLVFAVWICFFDDQDIITTHFKHKHELHKLEESRDYYLGQIENTKKNWNNSSLIPLPWKNMPGKSIG